MLIVLPPSETKAFGGDGAPLQWDNLSELSFAGLHDIRQEIARDLMALPIEQAFSVLGVSEKLRPELEANKQLANSPTMPAIFRYTGVLYDALDAPSLPDFALNPLAVGSALFGIVGATDPIPYYRLSGGTKLPLRYNSHNSDDTGNNSDGTNASKAPTMKKRWGSAITQALQEHGELIVDLRSGTYQQLGRVPAVTVRVESIREDGSRKVVSHFNKHYKGELARILALAVADGANPDSVDDVADIARSAGLLVEGPIDKQQCRELTLVIA
ncbi:peroxide stress protein YaaA [Corynebacterium sp. MSK297]|uniref:peroxide stress protein YaaA n=1 Tax=Corynebacterium sp. MSK297 TaxID=3050221 RepID=UPI00254A6623|nr:peroxide stress protein YaaA [Corynebacterium sp. MSK297]MDK8845088.1 peroxide stress protein YaaA [Corynebacterium sp. MSK297]